jgi:hypothetical protein
MAWADHCNQYNPFQTALEVQDAEMNVKRLERQQQPLPPPNRPNRGYDSSNARATTNVSFPKPQRQDQEEDYGNNDINTDATAPAMGGIQIRDSLKRKFKPPMRINQQGNNNINAVRNNVLIYRGVFDGEMRH